MDISLEFSNDISSSHWFFACFDPQVKLHVIIPKNTQKHNGFREKEHRVPHRLKKSLKQAIFAVLGQNKTQHNPRISRCFFALKSAPSYTAKIILAFPPFSVLSFSAPLPPQKDANHNIYGLCIWGKKFCTTCA
jgi:hypothetical protein